MRVCVCMCVRACVRVRARGCVCVCVFKWDLMPVSLVSRFGLAVRR